MQVQYWFNLQTILRNHYVYDHRFYEEVIALIKVNAKPNIELAEYIIDELDKIEMESEFLKVKPIFDEEKYYADLYNQELESEEDEEADYF